jgi:hypothetical protein
MEKYKVTWTSPGDKESILLERLIESENLGLPSKTHYRVKKKFFEEACSIIPELKKLGIADILRFLSVRKWDNNSHRSRYGSERVILGGRYSALQAWQKVSKISIERGLVPKQCPICKGFPITEEGKFLILHHWGPQDKLTCIRNGSYRRMCHSCNSYLKKLDLGWLYSKEATWEGQYSFLRKRFIDNSKQYPNYDGTEGQWSRFLKEEIKIFEELLIEASNRKLYEKC